jgi:eukaryotic-like serine/threonine-protein kinase
MKKNTQGLLEIGTVLNEKWVILELIGKGGMGEVYQAHQLNLKRDVAIKIVSQKLLATLDDDQRVETAQARFRREVKVMAQVHHPNVVQIFDYGSASFKKGDEEVPIEYIVMEFVPGSTLRFTMPEEGFYPQEKEVSAWILKYFFPVLDGVQALHEAGVIHRDLKPENFLLDGDIPKIADFGLARSVKLKSVTESLDVVGTPPYMAPDHFYDFMRVDQRGDMYSLGKILFEAIEGRMPPTTIPFKSAKLSKPNTPFFQALDRIIQEATAEDRDVRLDSAQKMRRALQQAVDDLKAQASSEPPPASRAPVVIRQSKWLWVGIAVAIFSMAAMTVWHLAGSPWWPRKPLPESGVYPQSTGAPAKTIMGKDGITMLLIPEGDFTIETSKGESRGHTIQLPSFYMDETKVSIDQFVDFLNGVKQELTVENGVVKRGGEIWLLLGEGSETHDQIIYRHDRFHVRDLKKAAQPAVRVTWYGASAYASYFDKRLPTEYEWEYAAQNAGSREGLKNMGGEIKEWVVRGRDGKKSGPQSSKPQVRIDYPSLVMGEGSPDGKPGTSKIKRIFSYPWEGFFDVGFRCVAGFRKS